MKLTQRFKNTENCSIVMVRQKGHEKQMDGTQNKNRKKREIID